MTGSYNWRIWRPRDETQVGNSNEINLVICSSKKVLKHIIVSSFPFFSQSSDRNDFHFFFYFFVCLFVCLKLKIALNDSTISYPCPTRIPIQYGRKNGANRGTTVYFFLFRYFKIIVKNHELLNFFFLFFSNSN